MDATRAHATRRIRRIRRDLRQLRRDVPKMVRHLKHEVDPEVLLTLREIFNDVREPLLIPDEGIAFQESRLPDPGGPADCMLCWTTMAEQCPVAEQRLFEQGLRRTGMSTEEVYELAEYRPRHPGTGRGWVHVTRGRHAYHANLYPDWRSAQGADTSKRGIR